MNGLLAVLHRCCLQSDVLLLWIVMILPLPADPPLLATSLSTPSSPRRRFKHCGMKTRGTLVTALVALLTHDCMQYPAAGCMAWRALDCSEV